MEVLYSRCAGIDVHKKLVVVCLMVVEENEAGKSQLRKETRTFSTLVKDLLAMGDWLKAEGCTHLVMESTASYWKPVYNLLEGQFELVVVNAQHIKAVPGRKTDVRDAEWLAELLRHGLLRASFIPSAPQRELRELTRYRTSLVEERSRIVNRLQKVLEDTNLKLASVVSNIMGQSARAILAKLLEGESDPELLADLAKGRLREKRAELVLALQGELKPHHRFMLTEQLGHIDYLDEAIERLGQEIEEQLRPFEEALVNLDSIPGVNQRIAEIILAEVGGDMDQFKDAAHLASWAGLCPGNKQSAGKRLSGKTRKGNAALRRALTEAGHAAGKTKNTYLGTKYRRIASRRGAKVAVLALAHNILVIVYYVLKRGEAYKELGVSYYSETEQAKKGQEKRFVKQLEKLGYQVSLKKAG